MTYKTQLNKMIQKSGRKRIWLCKQLAMDKVTFWRKVNSDKLSKEEKEKIKELLSK